MTRRAALLAAVLLLSGGTVTASADRPPTRWTYLFTQQHRDNLPWWHGTWQPQTVPSGAAVQIQLPGDPIRWIRDETRPCAPTGPAAAFPRAQVEFVGGHTLPNDGRISGTSTLYVFDYRITGHGAAVICLYPDPVPDTPQDIAMPPGTPLNYTLTVLAGMQSIGAVGRPEWQQMNRWEGADDDR